MDRKLPYMLTLSGAFLLNIKGKTRSWSQNLWSLLLQPYRKILLLRLWPWISQYKRTSLSSRSLLGVGEANKELSGYTGHEHDQGSFGVSSLRMSVDTFPPKKISAPNDLQRTLCPTSAPAGNMSPTLLASASQRNLMEKGMWKGEMGRPCISWQERGENLLKESPLWCRTVEREREVERGKNQRKPWFLTFQG